MHKWFGIIELTPGCYSSLRQHVFEIGAEFEEHITPIQNNMNLYLRDLNKISDYEKKTNYFNR